MGVAGTVHFLLDIIFLISNVFNLIHMSNKKNKKTNKEQHCTTHTRNVTEDQHARETQTMKYNFMK